MLHMSHTSIVKVKISNVNEQFLLYAISLIAQHVLKLPKVEIEHNGIVKDYYGHTFKCQFVLKVAGMGKAFGIGFNISSDGVEIIGDEFAIPQIKTFKQLLHDAYITVATTVSLMQLGYKNLNVIYDQNQGFVIEGVRI